MIKIVKGQMFLVFFVNMATITPLSLLVDINISVCHADKIGMNLHPYRKQFGQFDQQALGL